MICKEIECDSPVHAKQKCSKHYWKEFRTINREKIKVYEDSRRERKVANCKAYYKKNRDEILKQRRIKHWRELGKDQDRRIKNSELTCKEEGCNNSVRCLGLCTKHYTKLRYFRRHEHYKAQLRKRSNSDVFKSKRRERYWRNHDNMLEQQQTYRRNNPEIYLKSKQKQMQRLADNFSISSQGMFSGLYEWSKVVKKRDDNSCQVCGNNENLDAHHIFHKKFYPKLCLNPNNGITLCQRCHFDVHRKHFN